MDKKTEALKLALEYLRDNQHYIADNERHAYVMEYNAFVERLEALAEQPAQPQCPHDFLMGDDEPGHDSVCMQCGAAVPNDEPAQQQEPMAWYDEEYNCAYTAAELDGGTSDGLLPIYTSPASKPWVVLTDEQILSLVPGLQDCLCDPWDYNNSGDYYASIPKDMIRLARAIEAAHGIKENT